MSSLLDEPQIEKLVQRYLLEMARYERAAAAVADRLRRELRAEAQLRYLLSFRAKHPDDLRGKLLRKAQDGKANYSFERLDENLNSVVTDLAGCRVIVYSPPDRKRVCNLVRRIFKRPGREDAEETKNRDGYQAQHFLVLAPDEELSIRGAICEIQIATVAAHLFNEIEHDLVYKVRGHKVTEREQRFINDIGASAQVLDHLVEMLFEERARGEADVEDANELRMALERQAGRPLMGDFSRLFRMLETVLEPLNAAALTQLGGVENLLQNGADLAKEVGIEAADDVTCYALGILPEYLDELSMMVNHWRGPITPLRRAIEEAAKWLREAKKPERDDDANQR